MADTSCLYTTVRNISGEERHFPFLGEHGVTLADEAEFSQYGDIRDTVTQKFGGFGRQEKDLELALDQELLAIIKTPSPILYDETLEESVQLVVDNDVLSTEPVCWEAA